MNLSKDIIVIDNIIPKEDQNLLEEFIVDYRFDWHYGPSNVYDDGSNNKQSFFDENTEDSFQFTHVLFHPQITVAGTFISKFDFLIEKIKLALGSNEFYISRLKANLLTNNRKFSGKGYNYPHVDGEYPHFVVVYYVNDSDGDTWIFNEEFGTEFDKLTVKQRVSPKKGRIVAFPGKYFHASSNPSENDVRIVLNFNFAQANKTIL